MLSPSIVNIAAWVAAGVIGSQIVAVTIMYLVVRGYNALKGGYTSLDDAYYVVNLTSVVIVTAMIACAVLGALLGVWLSNHYGVKAGG